MNAGETGRRIRAARTYGGFAGRADFAKVLDISKETLQRIEEGKRAAKRSELLAIAEACEVPMWFLEGGWEGWRRSDESVDAMARKALQEIEGAPHRRQRRGTA